MLALMSLDEKRTRNERNQDDDDGDSSNASQGHGDEKPPATKRTRTWPHVDGNHASYVSLPVSITPVLERARARCLALIDEGDGASAVWEPIPVEQLHISVTRTFPVTRPNVLRFTRLVCNAIQDEQLSIFSVATLATPTCLVNDTGATSFIALSVDQNHSGYQELLGMTLALDSVLTKLGLPTFYDPPQFHISVAWAPGNLAERIEPRLIPCEEFGITIPLTRIDVLVGDNLHSFDLVASGSDEEDD